MVHTPGAGRRRNKQETLRTDGELPAKDMQNGLGRSCYTPTAAMMKILRAERI